MSDVAAASGPALVPSVPSVPLVPPLVQQSVPPSVPQTATAPSTTVVQVPQVTATTSNSKPVPDSSLSAPPIPPTAKVEQPVASIESQAVSDKKQLFTATYSDLTQLDKALDSLAQNIPTGPSTSSSQPCFYDATTVAGTSIPEKNVKVYDKASITIWNLNESFTFGISVRQQIISLLVARQASQFTRSDKQNQGIWDWIYDINGLKDWIPFPNKELTRFQELSLEIMKNEEQFASIYLQTQKFVNENAKDKTRPDVVYYGQQSLQFLEQIVNLRLNTIQMVSMFQQDQCLYDAFMIRSVCELLRFVQQQWDHDRSKQTKEKHATVAIMQKQLLQIPEMIQSQEKWKQLADIWAQSSLQYQQFRAELLFTVKTLDVELYNWLWIRSQIHPQFPVGPSQSINEIRYPLQMLISEHEQLRNKIATRQGALFTQNIVEQINNWQNKLETLSRQIKEADELAQKSKFLNNLLQLATQDQYALEQNQLAINSAESMQRSVKSVLERYAVDYIKMSKGQNDKLKKTKELSEIFNCHFNSNQEKLKKFSEFIYEQNAKCIEIEKKLLNLHSESLSIRLMNQLLQHIQTYKEYLF